jgi:FkbM family methyltransferase
MSLYTLLRGAVDSWSRRCGLECIKTHTLYARVLGPDSVVVDLGANVGDFTRGMISRFGCTSYAVEAMPNLFEQIEAGPKVHKFNVAVSDHDGTLELFQSSNRECNSIFSSIAGGEYEVQDSIVCRATTLESFLKDRGIESIDLLKLDIEGAEKHVFASTSDDTLRRVKQITIEFHDFVPDSITAEEVQSICDRLAGLGFLCIPASYVYPSMKTADFLFINMRLCQVPAGDRFGFGVVRALLGLEKAKSGLKSALRPRTAAKPGALPEPSGQPRTP